MFVAALRQTPKAHGLHLRMSSMPTVSLQPVLLSNLLYLTRPLPAAIGGCSSLPHFCDNGGCYTYAPSLHPFYDNSGKSVVLGFTCYPNIIQALNVVSQAEKVPLLKSYGMDAKRLMSNRRLLRIR